MNTQNEFEFTSQDFNRVKKLIYDKAGISLHDGKSVLVYGRLSRVLRQRKIPSFKEYLNWLQVQSHDSFAWQEFINSLTTNLTSFFREKHHFEYLENWLKENRHNSVNIWCCAASTGQEPYSIAMTALKANNFTNNVKILATDIDTNVLEVAKKGVYNQHDINIEEQMLKRFFLKGKEPYQDKVKVSSQLTQLVSFEQFNLIGNDWHKFANKFDIVFCRNVMIYFDALTQQKILKNIAHTLKPKGILFLGHSENVANSQSFFKLLGKTTYQKL